MPTVARPNAHGCTPQRPWLQAWLAVIAEQCETGNDVACEGLSFEAGAKQAWLATRADSAAAGAAGGQ